MWTIAWTKGVRKHVKYCQIEEKVENTKRTREEQKSMEIILKR